MDRHRDIARKNNQEIEAAPDRDRIIEALHTWRERHSQEFAPPGQDRVNQDRAKLDRILYGDHTPLERAHMALVHFFIEHQSWLLVMILFCLIATGLLLTFGLSSLRDLLGLF